MSTYFFFTSLSNQIHIKKNIVILNCYVDCTFDTAVADIYLVHMVFFLLLLLFTVQFFTYVIKKKKKYVFVILLP